MYEWYNFTVKYRGDWGTLGLRAHWDRPVWQKLYCDLFVNGTKTNQFPFSTLFKLMSIFYLKITFLGWSISVSIDHVISDFPMILVVSYTGAITLSLMYNGFASKTLDTKTMNNIRYKVSQGVSMCPKTVSRCPESISVKVPRKCLKVPPPFSGTYCYCNI